MKEFDISQVKYPAIVQPKLNGVGFYLTTDGIFYSPSSHKQFRFKGPRPPHGLYGEFYIHGKSLQYIAGLAALGELSPELQMHVYEVCNGKDMLGRVAAATVIKPPFVPVMYRIVASSREADEFYKRMLDEGYEGIVYRPVVDPEFPMMKRKPYRDNEFLCVGVIEGKGRRKGKVGAFVLRTGDGHLFKVGGGSITYEELEKYFHEPPINKLITVRYNSLSEKGIPLCPQFVGVREL